MPTPGAAAACRNRQASDVSSPLGRGLDTLCAQWGGAKVHWIVNSILCYSGFPGCTPSLSNKIKHMSEHETYYAAQGNYWSCKTAKDHSDIHLILALRIRKHLHGQRNPVPNVFIFSFTVLDLYGIIQKPFRRHSKVSLPANLRKFKNWEGRGFYSCFQRAFLYKKFLNCMWYLQILWL